MKTARPPQLRAPEQAIGRVDITDEVHRYVLYRFQHDDNTVWFIENPSTGNLDELTKDRFEDALKSYFA